MKIMVTLTQRAGVASATAEYDGKIITVLAGGKISPDFANHIRGGKSLKHIEIIQNMWIRMVIFLKTVSLPALQQRLSL